MKDIIAKALSDLLVTNPYSKISIGMICDAVPTSRRTFYNYFNNKNHLVEWIVERDFFELAFPLFSNHLGTVAVRSFFTYIKQNEVFYRRILEYDDGVFLTKCLVSVYDKTADLSDTFARPVFNSERRINPSVYRQYAHNGIAAVVVYWIRDGMKIDIPDIARDLGLMIELPLSHVRDHYLLIHSTQLS